MEKLIIGEVLKPQGIKGEIKIKTYLDDEKDIKYYKELSFGGQVYKILSARIAGGETFLTLKGIADRNAAELFRGKEITVERDCAKPLEKGRFYIVDLIGSEVVGENGEVFGTVTDVRQGATDVFTLKNGDGEILFPFVKDLFINVDIENKKITVAVKRFSEVAVYED